MVSRGMWKNFGVHWTRTLLGCLASLLMSVLFVLYVWVEKVRKVSRFAAEKMEGDGAERAEDEEKVPDLESECWDTLQSRMSKS